MQINYKTTYSALVTGMQQLVRCGDCCFDKSTVSSTNGRSSLASNLVHAATAAPKAASTFVAVLAEVSTNGGLPFSKHQARASLVEICFSVSGTST